MGSGFRTPYRVLLTAQIVIWGLVTQLPVAHAQLVPSVGAASAPAVDPMERAQRQADNVMRWIKVHAEKPRATPAPAPTPPTPAATKAAAPKPTAPAPVAPEPQKSETPIPPPVEVPVAAPVAAPAPVVPVQAPVAPPPPPEEEEELPLKAIAQPQPNISRNVLNSLNSGKVMVRFTVEPSGKTSNVEILSSSSRKLNSPTIAAVTEWRFQPIKLARTVQVEIDFLPQ